jgi:hypothetical protein
MLTPNLIDDSRSNLNLILDVIFCMKISKEGSILYDSKGETKDPSNQSKKIILIGNLLKTR